MAEIASARAPLVLRHAQGHADLAACFPVMRELRPHLADAAQFIERVERQSQAGYRLLAAWNGDHVVGVAGYRPAENLIYGRFMYVDDLAVAASERRAASARACSTAFATNAAARASRPWCWTRRSTTASASASTSATACWRGLAIFAVGRLMATLLRIDVSPRGAQSHSRRFADELVQALAGKGGLLRTIVRDLGAGPAASIDADYVRAMHAHATSHPRKACRNSRYRSN